MDFILFLAFLCVFGAYFYGRSGLTFRNDFMRFMVFSAIGVLLGYFTILGFVYVLSFLCIAGTCEPMATFVYSIYGGTYGAFAGFVIAVIVYTHNKFPTGIAFMSFIVFPLGVVLGMELSDDFYGGIFMSLISSVLVFYINSLIASLNDTKKRKNNEKTKGY